jgi:hypothetical protein
VVASKACDSANSGASMVRIKETMGAGLEKRRPYMLAKINKSWNITCSTIFMFPLSSIFISGVRFILIFVR